MQGTLRTFFQERGYGFIDGDDKQQYFVHATELINESPTRRIQFEEGQTLEFNIRPNEGKKCPAAVNVRILQEVR